MRFLRSFLLPLAALTLAYALVATVVNPRQELLGHFFPEIVANSRAIKLARLRAFNAGGAVDGLLFGSSRSMLLDPATLDSASGARYFNAAVFDGVPDDFLAMYRQLPRLGVHPHTIFVGLDHDVFRPEHRYPYDLRFNIELQARLAGREVSVLDRLAAGDALALRVFSRDYAVDIWHSIARAFPRRPPEHRYAPDGLMSYPQRDAQLAQGRYGRDEHISGCAREMAIARGAAIDMGRIRLLDTLLAAAARDSVRVVLWWTPIHPQLASRLEADSALRRGVTNAMEAVSRIAAPWHVPVLDLRRPAAFDADSADWYDCIHFGARNARRIARVLLTNGI